jgi:hypothetical protein
MPSFAGAHNGLGQTLDTERNGDGVACGTPASEGGCGADDCHLRYKRKFHHLRPPCAGAQSLSPLIPLLVAVAGFALKRSSLTLLFPLEAIRSSFVLLTHWEGCVVLCLFFLFFVGGKKSCFERYCFFLRYLSPSYELVAPSCASIDISIGRPSYVE